MDQPGRTLATVGGTAGRGWLVTLEGPEGSGKTTVAACLADALRRAGQDVVLTREPGGTPLGEAVRTVLLERGPETPIDPTAEALLFNAARAQLTRDVIEPAIGRGAVVVCARFADSTIAYQGFGRGLDPAGLRALERIATGGRRPDLTILLDVPVEVGLGRKDATDTTHFETLDRAFHERVRSGFLAVAAEEPERVVVVDASGTLDEVVGAALAALDRAPALARTVVRREP